MAPDLVLDDAGRSQLMLLIMTALLVETELNLGMLWVPIEFTSLKTPDGVGAVID